MASFSPLRPLLRAANSTPSSFLVRSTQRSSPFSSTAAQNYARLTIVGRLGADPELISTTSGQELVKYHVATTSGKSDNRQTSWFHITHFVAPEGRTRDYVLGLQKGTLVCVDGDATMKPFEDSEGKKRTSLNIIQKSLEVLKRPYSGPSEESQ